ncbi:growth hormone-regulated TBC protein 1-A-like [Asterias rubens]|uniref:growth hormone-regulated TBC protein 1-A-like n=1 Tax=Asterias rubens TaxID=7604 RepID=UPI0014558A09|nr:growth hormone-regulated TBC protein 1-A-like [Asterias rubens]
MAATGGTSNAQPSADFIRSEIDAYGFRRPDDFDYETYEQFMSQYLSVLARRAGKWDKVMDGKKNVKKSFKVKRYVRKGISNEYRGLVWMYVSGAEAMKEQNPGMYQRLLDGPKDAELMEVIKTDLHRTFPENIYFCNDSTVSKRTSLQNVLVAFAHHHRADGYCQGLNFIVALMLLILKDEESCFFLLETLVKNILPAYYTPQMAGLKTDQEVLGELVKQKLPAVAQRMEKEAVPWSIPTTKWFICLFLDVLPIETVLRIWDCLFYEGSKILFRVCLSLIKQNQDAILGASSFPSLIESFKTVTLHSRNTDCHTFMQNVFADSQPLSRALIEKFRTKSNEDETN